MCIGYYEKENQTQSYLFNWMVFWWSVQSIYPEPVNQKVKKKKKKKRERLAKHKSSQPLEEK